MRKRKIELRSSGLFSEPGFLHWQGAFSELRKGGISIALFGENKWLSPLRAPFGGFIFEEDFSPEKFRSFLELLDKSALEREILSIEIQSPAGFYFQSHFEAFNQILTAHGFACMFNDLNFHLPVDRPFIQHLHHSEQWKLRKASKLGFSFRQALAPDIALVHAFILASRLRKGYQLSMSKEALDSVFSAFPGRYRVWEVLSPEGKLAALAVSVWVSSEVEYLFYTADDPQFRHVSPVVMLHEGIYEVISEEGKEILDLGTASLQGDVNKGVADFKRFLGGIESRKIRFRKTWNQVSAKNPAGK